MIILNIFFLCSFVQEPLKKTSKTIFDKDCVCVGLQEARGKRQEARGKRQEARGKRQETQGEIKETTSAGASAATDAAATLSEPTASW